MRRGKAKLFLESLLKNGKIAVLTEDERENDPVIVAGSDLTVCAMKAGEGLVAPRGNVRRRPGAADFFGLVKSSRGVTNVACGEQIAASKGFKRFANQHAVHNHFCARGEILSNKLMLGGNIRGQHVVFCVKADALALPQVCEGHENVVARVQLQDLALRCSVTWHLDFALSNSLALGFSKKQLPSLRLPAASRLGITSKSVFRQGLEFFACSF